MSFSWQESMIDDTMKHIASFLDPLSRILWCLAGRMPYWVLHPGTRIDMQELLFKHGTLKLVQLVPPFHHRHMSICYAAQRGNMDVLLWLYAQGYPVYQNVLESAAYGGQIAAMEWLRSLDVSFSKQTLQQAVVGGSADAVEWLLDHDCPMPFPMYYNAIEYGRVDVIMCLYKRRCPWRFGWKDKREEMLQLLTPPRSALMAVLVDEIKEDLKRREHA